MKALRLTLLRRHAQINKVLQKKFQIGVLVGKILRLTLLGGNSNINCYERNYKINIVREEILRLTLC